MKNLKRTLFVVQVAHYNIMETPDITPTEIKIEEVQDVPEVEKELTYLEHIALLYGSIAEANRSIFVSGRKDGPTMQNSRDIKYARETLIDYFTLEEGEDKLSPVTKSETSALSVIIEILETQQSMGVFSIDGSDKILTSIDVLSEALTQKTPAQRMKDAQRNLKAGKKSKARK